MAARAPTGGGELVGLQYLRGLAAAMVVCFHLTGKLDGGDGVRASFGVLGAGVDIFFVLSGFVMAYSTGDGASMGPARFLKRRFIRIVPLYWIATSAMLLALLVAPGLPRSAALDWPHVASSFLFLPYPHPTQDGLLFPLVIPGWTINLEMFFYALFAIGLAVGRGRRLVPLAVTTAILLLFVLVGRAGDAMRSTETWRYYANPMTLEFAAGMWLAVAYRRLPSMRPAWALFVACAGLGALLTARSWALPVFAMTFVGSGLLVYGAANVGTLRVPWASLLGDSSYSLYLSQTFSVSAWGMVAEAAGLLSTPVGRGAFLGAGIVIAALVGLVCWRFIERPATALARGLVDGRPPRRPLVGVERATR